LSNFVFIYALKPNDLQFVFLSSFPCLTKPKHWTPELQRQLAVKRGDRMFVNLPHNEYKFSFATDSYLSDEVEEGVVEASV
jgi:hypothetical protein